MEVISNRYPTNFGDPRVGEDTYSRVTFALPVTRSAGTYASKLSLRAPTAGASPC